MAFAAATPSSHAADAPATSVAPADARPALPLWEAGIAAGAGYLPDYPGADRSRWRGVAVPVLLYRGPVLRVDQDGIRGRLARRQDWEFDLSASAAFNARNNPARDGMPPLDYQFGIGPQWIYKGLADADGGGLTLHLKWRSVLSTDFRRIDMRGATADVELRWRWLRVADTPTTLTLSAQSSWASRSLQRTFYEVSPAQATTQRPAHAARAGYFGTELAATLNLRPAPEVAWFVTARGLSTHGAANRDSPLMQRRFGLSIGTGVVWMPWRSRRGAAD